MNKDNIKLIVGNRGSGKSTFIYNYFLDNCKNVDGTLDLSKKFYLVVPEQDTQDKQDMIIRLAKDQNQGIFNIDVISFDRLFYMVCKELNVNVDSEKIIDDDIKRLVLRLAIQNLEKSGVDFVYFKNMKNKVGFTDKLKSAMSELYSYNIDKEVLDKVLSKTENDRLKEKMQELSLIQEEFKKILKEKDFSIQEDKMNILYKIIDKSKICDDAVFAFDGFTGFTPMQKDIFYKICEKSKEVYVSIDIRDVDVKSIVANFGYRDTSILKMTDVFYLSKLFINQIYDIAIIQKKTINENNIIDLCKSNHKLYNEKISKYKDRADLSYLEQSIYKKNIKRYDKKVENISIHVSKDIESEVDFLINKINYLRRTYGYSLNDIKVVAPDISEYADILIKKCEGYDINVYVDNKKTIYNSPLVEMIRSLFDVLLYNFNYDSVMRYLNSGLFNKKYNKDIYLFDNAIRKYGIKGYKKYQELLEKKKTIIVNRKSHMFKNNIEEHIDDVINIKNKLLSEVINLYEDLSHLKSYFTISEYIEKIEIFLEKADIYGLFNEVIDGFQDKSDFDYLVLKNNEKLVKNIFEKIKILSKDDKEKVDFSCVRDLFNVSIEGKTIPLSPPTMEELECGDLMRSRFDNPKVLFFLGFNESKVPRKSKDNNIIDDDMRIYFKNTEGIILSQTTKETSLNQRFYVYLSLTNPTDKLYLSYTSKNADGTKDYPSNILLNIMHRFDLSPIKEEKDDYELYTKNDMIDYVYRHLYDAKIVCKNIEKGKNDISYKKDLISYEKAVHTKQVLSYLRDKLKKNEIENFDKKSFDTDTNINLNIMKDIIGNEYVSSVTKLEDFSICPYKYFLDYTIGLSEREKYEIDARDMGNVFHKVLEDVFESPSFDIVSMKNEDIDNIVKNAIDNIIKENDKFNDTNGAIFLSERLRDAVTYSLYRLRENLYNNNPTHIASEEKLSYDIKDTKDILSGKIDTIDNYKNNDDKKDFVRVVDYKSSNKAHNDEDLKSGVNIQYIVYLDYVLNNLKNICAKHKIPYDESYMTKPLGTFYFQIHDDIKCLTRDNLESIKLDDMKNDYKYKGIVNDEALHIIDSDATVSKKNQVISTIIEGPSMSEADIENTIKDVNDNIKKNISDIKNGKISATPYKKYNQSCDVCSYKAICKKNLHQDVVDDIDEISEVNNIGDGIGEDKK